MHKEITGEFIQIQGFGAWAWAETEPEPETAIGLTAKILQAPNPCYKSHQPKAVVTLYPNKVMASIENRMLEEGRLFQADLKA